MYKVVDPSATPRHSPPAAARTSHATPRRREGGQPEQPRQPPRSPRRAVSSRGRSRITCSPASQSASSPASRHMTSRSGPSLRWLRLHRLRAAQLTGSGMGAAGLAVHRPISSELPSETGATRHNLPNATFLTRRIRREGHFFTTQVSNTTPKGTVPVQQSHNYYQLNAGKAWRAEVVQTDSPRSREPDGPGQFPGRTVTEPRRV